MSDRFARSGRSWTALVVLAAVWAAIFAAWLMLDAAWWIVAGLIAVTLPAAWEFATARQAWLCVDADGLTWASGRTKGQVSFEKIDHVRLETRLDFSPRVRLVLTDGKRLPLPPDCTPPHAQLEPKLRAQGLRCERHPFALL
ncbi:hypothetical protein [Tropicibacter naphthalenivorans]|uniref:Uncharacterized protein n=1 Tax=Tropicibacter naphthalenivorans TaxID=441103 RepID=A0A0P1G4A8_9RHOB|nr:hypothetical protein [Tropicibacter naphthalenivorans]CUH76652.1 hypothetical protein TRN7648_01049 [Tropicibacter naphthalenivorans]SMC64273.1 hypothetical protein SAMN04488093_102569 [Tropicibacter naphthalenivorans]